MFNYLEKNQHLTELFGNCNNCYNAYIQEDYPFVLNISKIIYGDILKDASRACKLKEKTKETTRIKVIAKKKYFKKAEAVKIFLKFPIQVKTLEKQKKPSRKKINLLIKNLYILVGEYTIAGGFRNSYPPFKNDYTKISKDKRINLTYSYSFEVIRHNGEVKKKGKSYLTFCLDITNQDNKHKIKDIKLEYLIGVHKSTIKKIVLGKNVLEIPITKKTPATVKFSTCVTYKQGLFKTIKKWMSLERSIINLR
jgi:hypothetical protein